MMTAYEKALRDIKGLQESLRLNGLEIASASGTPNPYRQWYMADA